MKKQDDDPIRPKILKPIPWELQGRDNLIYGENGWYDPDEKSENNPTAAQKEWMNAMEASEYLGIAKGTIYNYVSKGKIPHSKKGGLKFNKTDLDEWMKTDEFSLATLRSLKRKGKKYGV
jgi:excisionase family DNA binding protein